MVSARKVKALKQEKLAATTEAVDVAEAAAAAAAVAASGAVHIASAMEVYAEAAVRTARAATKNAADTNRSLVASMQRMDAAVPEEVKVAAGLCGICSGNCDRVEPFEALPGGHHYHVACREWMCVGHSCLLCLPPVALCLQLNTVPCNARPDIFKTQSL